MEKNGESVVGLTNLGLAYEYSGEMEAAVAAARRAHEIGPDDPKALAYLGRLLAKHESDEDGALELLLRCRELAPDDTEGLETLAVVYLRRGEFEKAGETLGLMMERGMIARPLQDYAYNMLVGLPEGAVLITNGDTDTFSPLALQALRDFRTDVIVVNRHLLNLDAYAEAVYKLLSPAGFKKPVIPAHVQRPSDTILKSMVDEDNVNLYFATSVALHQLDFEPDLVIDGMNLRSSKEGLSAEESALLFLDAYRLDSATDWNYAWDLYPNAAGLMTNYVSCMVRIVSERGGLSSETQRKLLAKGLEIAEFHNIDRLISWIKSLQKK
jgi:tetratricopeptide (TPR) repeat protein